MMSISSKEIKERNRVVCHFAVGCLFALLLEANVVLCVCLVCDGSRGTFSLRVNFGISIYSNSSGIIPSVLMLSYALSSICVMSEVILRGLVPLPTKRSSIGVSVSIAWSHQGGRT